jgi:site-specific DNA-cytosine methylase
MKQLGDLEALSSDNVEPTYVLIVGTTCTAVSILGMQRGLADIKMEHMLMVARWAVKVGFEVMVFEMVPNILGFDQGAIQIVLENILREAGYEVSRRVENLWTRGHKEVQ